MNRFLSPFQAILDLFKHPSAEAIAQRQLEEAEREILRHKDASEYHDAMVGYLENKIARLSGEQEISQMASNIMSMSADDFSRLYAEKAR